VKVIIAGSRSLGRISQRSWDYEQLVKWVDEAVAASGFEVTEVISGGAGGPDRAGEQWAAARNIPVTQIKPDWSRGRGAGLNNNRDLAAAGEALIALYDGGSFGTRDMINLMRRAGLKVFVQEIADED
jgi:hypothetical protein